MRHTRRSVLVALIVVAGLTVGVRAHMKLVKSEPANGATVATAPTAIGLFFSEKIDPSVSRIVLKGAAGDVALAAPQAMGANRLTAPITGTLSDGAYTVTWQSAGKDGHIIKGQLAFSVKRARTE